MIHKRVTVLGHIQIKKILHGAQGEIKPMVLVWQHKQIEKAEKNCQCHCKFKKNIFYIPKRILVRFTPT